MLKVKNDAELLIPLFAKTKGHRAKKKGIRTVIRVQLNPRL